MAAVLDHVADRLKAGAKADLLALAQITFVKSRTARVFYENSYKSVAYIANADPEELVPVLMQVMFNASMYAILPTDEPPGATNEATPERERRTEV